MWLISACLTTIGCSINQDLEQALTRYCSGTNMLCLKTNLAYATFTLNSSPNSPIQDILTDCDGGGDAGDLDGGVGGGGGETLAVEIHGYVVDYILMAGLDLLPWHLSIYISI